MKYLVRIGDSDVCMENFEKCYEEYDRCEKKKLKRN